MNALQQTIASILEQTDIQKLKLASQNLTLSYREGLSLANEEDLIAYLIVRMPATYAAISSVLKNIPPPNTILDIGAGPGTLYWAAHSLWNNIPIITAIEREKAFIELGKKMGSQVEWMQEDAIRIISFKAHDWVFFGYSLGEMPQQSRLSFLEKCWQSARQGIILVEPGTPRGHQNILQARTHLIQLGGSVRAPCPHSSICPMAAPDWCHFSVRLDRSHLHRIAKMATLPYEDEKFSYAIVAKTQPTNSFSRIIHSPVHRSGHSILTLCTSQGLQTLTLSKRLKERYQKARKSKWGDSFIN